LIPIGDKPVIEIIMDRFAEHGITDFYVSVNHKEKMIRAFFEDSHNRYTISYINEECYLGTAGALKYLEGEFDTPFIVSNCDIIIDTDYTKISDFHRDGNYDLTLVVSVQHHVIPYGVCKLRNEGELDTMVPACIFLIPRFCLLFRRTNGLICPTLFKHCRTKISVLASIRCRVSPGLILDSGKNTKKP